jgi:hypothetical protein
MRGVARCLIRLYPARWRARYGEEFEALIDDTSSGWAAVFDLLKGAIQMQFSVPAFPKLALMLSIAGLLAGLLVSYSVTPIYFSEAVLELKGIGAGSVPRVEYLLQSEQELLSRTSLKRLIEDPRLNLFSEERAKIPLEDVIEEMRKKDIRIRVGTPPIARQSSTPGAFVFSVGFAYRDRVKAHDTVQELLTRLIEVNFTRRHAQPTAGQPDQVRLLEARVALLEKRLGIPSAAPEPGDQLAPVYAGMNLEVIDPPSLPALPLIPNRSVFMFYGFVAGIVAASFVAIFRRRPPPLTLRAA